MSDDDCLLCRSVAMVVGAVASITISSAVALPKTCLSMADNGCLLCRPVAMAAGAVASLSTSSAVALPQPYLPTAVPPALRNLSILGAAALLFAPPLLRCASPVDDLGGTVQRSVCRCRASCELELPVLVCTSSLHVEG